MKIKKCLKRLIILLLCEMVCTICGVVNGATCQARRVTWPVRMRADQPPSQAGHRGTPARPHTRARAHAVLPLQVANCKTIQVYDGLDYLWLILIERQAPPPSPLPSCVVIMHLYPLTNRMGWQLWPGVRWGVDGDWHIDNTSIWHKSNLWRGGNKFKPIF